ncbi:MAG: response regulator, partial [Gaiellales bacterium]
MSDSAAQELQAAEADPRPTVLVVDDEPANVQSIEAILEPLDVQLLTASSGKAALRVLLKQDVAVIVLDVRMPGMDGFETAQLVKQRPRTKHVPIIFLTALANDREQALSGYEAGGIDYMEKPVEPVVLRAKVASFAALHESRRQVEHQAGLLRIADAREAERELVAERERGQQQFRDLAEVLPAMVFAVDEHARTTYVSPQWQQYTGAQAATPLMSELDWAGVHPAERMEAERTWSDAFIDPSSLPSGRIELVARLRRHDGAYLWHSITAAARYVDDQFVGFVGSAREIDSRWRTEDGQRVLSDAGGVLVSTEDLDEALVQVADLAVPALVDWCTIDLLEDDGLLRRVAMRVDGNVASEDVQRLASNLALDGEGSLPMAIIAADGPTRMLVCPDGQPLDPADANGDGPRPDALLVPLITRGVRVGVLSVALAALGRRLGQPERYFAGALATRLSSAIDAARMYRSAQERAQASEVLGAIADGVALIDRRGIVRLWNPAAELITGVEAATIIGQRVSAVLPDWDTLGERIPVGEPGELRRSVTTPLATPDDRELWLSISAVGFELGVAYAFRDLTAERAVERMKSDFVATVSHELRTPLASIYGAAVTLQRDDVELDETMRTQLLDIIGQQSQQLAAIVEDVLNASRLDAEDGSPVQTMAVDAHKVAREVIEASQRRTDQHDVALDAPEDLPMVEADPGHLRQVLDNLVENAIKYSPAGGCVRLKIEPNERNVAFRIEDDGIGIAAADHERVFEKFY